MSANRGSQARPQINGFSTANPPRDTIVMTDPDLLLRDALRVLDRHAVTLPAPNLPSARGALDNLMFDDEGAVETMW